MPHLEKITKKPLGFLEFFFKRKDFYFYLGEEKENPPFWGVFSLYFFVLKVLSSFYFSCYFSIKTHICVRNGGGTTFWKKREEEIDILGRVISWKSFLFASWKLQSLLWLQCFLLQKWILWVFSKTHPFKFFFLFP